MRGKIGTCGTTLLMFLLMAALAPAASFAAPPAMTPIPAPAKQLPMQPIAEQLGQQLQSLVSPPPAANEEPEQEPPQTFGTRALNVVINVTEILRNQTQHFITEFSALPQLSDWFAQQNRDPHLAARWQSVWNDLLSTAGVALLAALVLELLLYPLRRILRKRRPHALALRMTVVLSLFFLRAVPIIIFVAVSVNLLNEYETQKLPRFLIMNVVYALALARTTVSFLRGILSPTAEALRFVPVSNAQAVYGYRWLRAFSLLIIFGYFCIEVARAARVPDSAVTAFINTLGLILVAMSVIVIMQVRAYVRTLLRGDLSAAQPDLSWFDVLRLWFARHWSALAVIYLVIGYLIAAAGVQNGIVLMLRGTILTLLVLVAARLLFREISLLEMRSGRGAMTLYALIRSTILRLVVIVLAIAGGLAAWGVDVTLLANTPLGHRLLGSALSIGTTLFILGLIYEMFSTHVDRRLTARKSDGKPADISARARTLLPMMRNAVFLIFLSIIGFVVLSEAGVNVGPLLAGAGVLGVAVGFGSQTLVKDFLTGLFIVLENTIAVGDAIRIGDQFGMVEAMTMRTLRLRDFDGAVHIVPFSEVAKVSNFSKGFAYALFKVNVSSDTDLNRAAAAIRAVGAEMQADPAFKHAILEPVEFMGVESINDASVTLEARIRTQPGKQWTIRRMFLFRLMERFNKEGIETPSWTTIRMDEKQT